MEYAKTSPRSIFWEDGPRGQSCGILKKMKSKQKIGKRKKRAKRPSWDEYFLGIAQMVASRSTCDRKNVGAVLVRGKTILSTGYNGSARGMDHCDDAGHEIVDGHCIRTVHAEANALVQAARQGAAVEGATLYLTNSPCYDCFKMIVNAGITKVIYRDFYMSRYEASGAVLKLAKKAGVEIVRQA